MAASLPYSITRAEEGRVGQVFDLLYLSYTLNECNYMVSKEGNPHE